MQESQSNLFGNLTYLPSKGVSSRPQGNTPLSSADPSSGIKVSKSPPSGEAPIFIVQFPFSALSITVHPITFFEPGFAS